MRYIVSDQVKELIRLSGSKDMNIALNAQKIINSMYITPFNRKLKELFH